MVRFFIAVVCVVLGLVGSAQAEWYVGAGGGLSSSSVTDLRQSQGATNTTFSDLSTSNSWTANGRVGYWLPNMANSLIPMSAIGLEAQGFTARGQWGAQNVGFNAETTTFVPTLFPPSPGCPAPCIVPVQHTATASGSAGITSGHVRLDGAFGNVLLRWPTGPVRPYAEAGVGFAFVSAPNTGLGSPSNVVPAYNAGAGVEVMLGSQFGVNVAYQHIWAPVHFDQGAKADVAFDLVTGGLVWHFQ